MHTRLLLNAGKDGFGMKSHFLHYSEYAGHTQLGCYQHGKYLTNGTNKRLPATYLQSISQSLREYKALCFLCFQKESKSYISSRPLM